MERKVFAFIRKDINVCHTIIETSNIVEELQKLTNDLIVEIPKWDESYLNKPYYNNVWQEKPPGSYIWDITEWKFITEEESNRINSQA